MRFRLSPNHSAIFGALKMFWSSVPVPEHRRTNPYLPVGRHFAFGIFPLVFAVEVHPCIDDSDHVINPAKLISIRRMIRRLNNQRKNRLMMEGWLPLRFGISFMAISLCPENAQTLLASGRWQRLFWRRSHPAFARFGPISQKTFAVQTGSYHFQRRSRRFHHQRLRGVSRGEVNGKNRQPNGGKAGPYPAARPDHVVTPSRIEMRSANRAG